MAQSRLAILILLSATLALGCGGSSDSPSPSPEPPADGFQFEVELSFSNGDSVGPTQYAYPRCPKINGKESCLEPSGDQKQGWTGANGKTFEYLQTGQFVLDAGSMPTGLKVRDLKGQAQCMAVYFQGPSTQGQNSNAIFATGLDAGTAGYPLPVEPTLAAPVHLTLIPFPSDDGCQTNSGPYESERALALWLSMRPEAVTEGADEIVCNLTSGLDYTQDPIQVGQCILDQPQWRQGTGSSSDRFYFTGTLWTMLNSPTPPSKITIYLAEDLSLNIPISSAYVDLKVASGSNVQDCVAAIAKLNAGETPDTNCQTDNIGVWTLETDTQFVVNGFGRINGFSVLESLDDPNDRIYSPSSASAIGNFDAYARFVINSALIALSSGSTVSPSIKVENITTAWTAKRGQGAAELNSAYYPVQSGNSGGADYEANNKEVNVFDYKQAGSWLGESDGPEMMGADSKMDYAYLHICDDAIKVSAPGVQVSQATVLKGNSGGVVNLGSYGLNRGVSGSQVSGAWAHRITHKKSRPSNDPGMGVVISRTCPVASIGSLTNSGSLSDSGISNVYVPFLPGDVNSMDAPIRLVTFSDCRGSEPHATNFTIGNIDFLDFDLRVIPESPSLLRSDSWSADAWVPTWTDVYFYNKSAGTPQPTSGVLLYPEANVGVDAGGTGYFICGVGDSGATNPLCWSTMGEGQGNPLPSTNLVYEGETSVFDGIVQFPYGPLP